MWLFYVLIAYICVISLMIYKRDIIFQKRNHSRDSLFLILTMGLLFLLNALRSLYTGNDTLSYYNLFRYYSSGYTAAQYSSAGFEWMDSYIDIGWRYLNKGFSAISTNYQLFISVIAAFLYWFTTKYIKNHSQNITLSVLLFFLIMFHSYLNILRQAVAIVIILMAYGLLKDKKYVPFGLCVLVATLFHKFALISLFLILFQSINFNKTISKIVLLTSIILSVSGGILLFPTLLGYNGGHLDDQAGISSVFAIILNGVVYLSMEYLVSSNRDSNTYYWRVDEYSFFRWINLVTLCLSILETALPVLYRIEYYFSVYQIIGIPAIMMHSDRDKKSINLILLIVVSTIIVYRTGIAIFRPEWMTDFPYHFFWQGGY